MIYQHISMFLFFTPYTRAHCHTQTLLDQQIPKIKQVFMTKCICFNVIVYHVSLNGVSSLVKVLEV